MSTVTNLVAAFLAQKLPIGPEIVPNWPVLPQLRIKLTYICCVNFKLISFGNVTALVTVLIFDVFCPLGFCRAKSRAKICQNPRHNKKLPLLGALSCNGAGERTSAYPLRGSAPASAACRRPRQLAKNAPRFLDARSFAGSSPCVGPITKKLPLLGALSFNGAGERT